MLIALRLIFVIIIFQTIPINYYPVLQIFQKLEILISAVIFEI